MVLQTLVVGFQSYLFKTEIVKHSASWEGFYYIFVEVPWIVCLAVVILAGNLRQLIKVRITPLLFCYVTLATITVVEYLMISSLPTHGC